MNRILPSLLNLTSVTSPVTDPPTPTPTPLALSPFMKTPPTVVPIKCVDGTHVQPFILPPRPTLVEKLKSSQYDVVVIGGGATGTGTALDLATRGLKVALIDRDDFASGTSGRSTKLIHGGIRYLQEAFLKLDYGKYELVKEALTERNHMLKCAPYMNHALPIMIPMYNTGLLSYLKIPYYMIGKWGGAFCPRF